MSGSDPTTTRTPICDTTVLAHGGFAPDTEVMTADGPQQISDLRPGQRVYALNPTTKQLKLVPIVDVETTDPPLNCVHIETRRADLLVEPSHRIPYTTKAIQRPRFISAGDLSEREEYNFINTWLTRSGTQLAQIDITDYCDDYEMNAQFDWHGQRVQARLPDGCTPCRQNTHTGYYFQPAVFEPYQNEIEALAETVRIHAGPNHWRRPYRFDGDDFIEFVGWFATEGSITRKQNSHSATIKIAQSSQRYRPRLQALFDRMGLSVTAKSSGFSFGSLVFARLLERFCGRDAASKRLPEFIWDCSAAQKELLLEVLLAGDGNDDGVFYTASWPLLTDTLRLCLELGRKPRYWQTDIWALSTAEVTDGFTYSRNVCTRPAQGPFYRLAIRDFSTVMAGRNGKFQWVGVSAVA